MRKLLAGVLLSLVAWLAAGCATTNDDKVSTIPWDRPKTGKDSGASAACVRPVARDITSKQFRDLHGVQCRAFEELVAADKQFNPASVVPRHILADPAHQAIVHSAGVDGHRVLLVPRIVHHFHAGRL